MLNYFEVTWDSHALNVDGHSQLSVRLLCRATSAVETNKNLRRRARQGAMDGGNRPALPGLHDVLAAREARAASGAPCGGCRPQLRL